MTRQQIEKALSNVNNEDLVYLITKSIASHGGYSASSLDIEVKKENIEFDEDMLVITHRQKNKLVTLGDDSEGYNTLFIPCEEVSIIWLKKIKK